MDKIKRFIDCYIPTETCNLRCHYCYITQQRKFNNKIAQLKYSTEVTKKALSKERLGGVCLFNLCAGGETLLAAEVISVIKALLENGHYVMVVTNGTLSKRFDEILKFDSKLLERLFFKFSFHFLELKRINKMDEYFENIKKVSLKGCSFTLEITPNDEVIPYIDEIKEICLKKLGALCHVTIARDDRTNGIEILSKYSFEEYQKIWSSFDSGFFNYKASIFHKKRNEFCYAGDWSFYLNLVTGSIKQCYCGSELDNIYKRIDKPLHLRAIGYGCKQPHCYNGHAFLTLGNIPELNSPTLGEIRNRKDENGNEWLKPRMKDFMNQKLSSNNEEYLDNRKKMIMIENNIKKITAIPNKAFLKVKKIIGN